MATLDQIVAYMAASGNRLMFLVFKSPRGTFDFMSPDDRIPGVDPPAPTDKPRLSLVKSGDAKSESPTP